MRGLIYKDLLTTNSYKRSFLIILLLFGALALTNDGYTSFLSFYIPFFVVMLCISTFNYDEYSKWDAYALTLPITRKEIVKSKYLFSLGMLFLASIFGVVISLILNYVRTKGIDLEESLVSLAGVNAGMLLLLSLMYPLIYKFGSEKGRTFLFVIIFGATTIIGGLGLVFQNALNNTPWINSVIEAFNNYGVYFTIVIVLGLFYLSYRISCRLYLKKEF